MVRARHAAAIHVVTGASAGALIAPFAFLGPAYDEMLKSVFVSGEMANLLQSDVMGGTVRPALFKTAPFRDLIARHVDADCSKRSRASIGRAAASMS